MTPSSARYGSLRGDPCERALRREGADVQLVQDEILVIDAAPFLVGPGEGPRIDDLLTDRARPRAGSATRGPGTCQRRSGSDRAIRPSRPRYSRPTCRRGTALAGRPVPGDRLVHWTRRGLDRALRARPRPALAQEPTHGNECHLLRPTPQAKASTARSGPPRRGHCRVLREVGLGARTATTPNA